MFNLLSETFPKLTHKQCINPTEGYQLQVDTGLVMKFFPMLQICSQNLAIFSLSNNNV